jgi:hypothetical protein
MSTLEEIITQADLASADLETHANLAETNTAGTTNQVSVNKQDKGFITLPQINNTEFNRGILGVLFAETPEQSTESFIEVEMYMPNFVTDTAIDAQVAVGELAVANCFQTSGYKTTRFPLYPSREVVYSENISDLALMNATKAEGNLEKLLTKHNRSAAYALSKTIQVKAYQNASTNAASGELIGIKTLMNKYDVAVTGTATAAAAEGYYRNNIAYSVVNTNLAVLSILATHQNRVSENGVTKAILIVPTGTGAAFKKYFKDQADTAPIGVYNITPENSQDLTPFAPGGAYSMFLDKGDKFQILSDMWIVESKQVTSQEATYLPIEINGIAAFVNKYIGSEVVRTTFMYNGDRTKDYLLSNGVSPDQLEYQPATAQFPCNSASVKKDWFGYLFLQGAGLGRVWTGIVLLTNSNLPTAAQTVPVLAQTINLYA